MITAQRQAPACVTTHVEMFSDVCICQHDECRIVQVMNRWWLYDDGSYVLSVHPVDDPMGGSTIAGSDAGGRTMLETRTAAMWGLAQR
jgi:hypothetical protein